LRATQASCSDISLFLEGTLFTGAKFLYHQLRPYTPSRRSGAITLLGNYFRVPAAFRFFVFGGLAVLYYQIDSMKNKANRHHPSLSTSQAATQLQDLRKISQKK
jgi:hypothetical protein